MAHTKEELYIELMWHSVGNQYYEEKLNDINFRGGTVLDIGCGPGQWSVAASKSNKRVLSIDANANFIDYLNKYISTNKITNIETCVAEVLEWNNANEKFDFIICYNMLQYLQEDKIIEILSNALKPGGKLFLSTNGSGYYLEKIVKSIKHIKVKSFFSYILLMIRSQTRNLIGNYATIKKKESYISIKRLISILEYNKLILDECRIGGLPINEKKTYAFKPYFIELICYKSF